MVVGDFPIETDTIVIGAGPGGYVAAIRAAQLGQKVTIVEKGNLGGVCLNVGCIPSKALLHASHRFVEAQHSENLGVIAESVSLNFQKVQEFKSSVVNKLTGGVEGLLKGNKVNIVKGHKHTTLKMQSLQQVQDQLKFLISNSVNVLSTQQVL